MTSIIILMHTSSLHKWSPQDLWGLHLWGPKFYIGCNNRINVEISFSRSRNGNNCIWHEMSFSTGDSMLYKWKHQGLTLFEGPKFNTDCNATILLQSVCYTHTHTHTHTEL